MNDLGQLMEIACAGAEKRLVPRADEDCAALLETARLFETGKYVDPPRASLAFYKEAPLWTTRFRRAQPDAEPAPIVVGRGGFRSASPVLCPKHNSSPRPVAYTGSAEAVASLQLSKVGTGFVGMLSIRGGL